MKHYRDSGFWILGLFLFIVLAVSLVSVTRSGLISKDGMTGFAIDDCDVAHGGDCNGVYVTQSGATYAINNYNLYLKQNDGSYTKIGGTTQITAISGILASASKDQLPASFPTIVVAQNHPSTPCTGCNC